TKRSLDSGKLNPESTPTRIARLDALKEKVWASRELLVSPGDENEEKPNIREDQILETLDDLADLLSELLDVTPPPASSATSTPSSTKHRTKIDVGHFDEAFPDIWFQRLEIQLEAAGLLDNAARFSELLRFLDKRQSLAVAPETLGDGEFLADVRARISPRTKDLVIDDVIKFVLFREMPRHLATHLAKSFDTLSLDDFQKAGDKLLADDRRRSGPT
ncbi:Hypothetical predicted protein, partial [Paramuricea clavata]